MMDFQIKISSDAAELLGQKCIGPEEAKTAISIAERDKLYFEGKDGERLCVLHLENVTYWVSYMPRGDVFEVQSAYFHRMKFEELFEG